MKHLRNRFIAGALAFVVAASSLQLPVGNVRAEEAVEEVKETEITVTEEAGSEEGAVSESVPEIGECVSEETRTVAEKESDGIAKMDTESTEIVESVTETDTESIETVETIVETDTDGQNKETQEVEVATTELESEIREETSEAENTEEAVQTEELTQESEEETETEQALKASEDDIVSGSYGNITWVIDANGKLTVEGTGEFSGKTGSGRAPWYIYRLGIRTAEINVTGMTNASYMFEGYDELTEINLSGMDASSISNMRNIFSECYELNKIYTPCNLNIKVELPTKGRYSNVRYGYYWKDSNGQEITELPLNRNDSILIMREERRSGRYGNITWTIDDDGKLTVEGTGEFSEKTGYERAPWFGKDIKTAEINVTGMTDASYMFAGCRGLTEINLSGLDASSVTNINGMFIDCYGLDKIYTPCNLNIKVKPPSHPWAWTWKDSNGQEITELPLNRSDSILIMKEDTSGSSGSYKDITWTIDDNGKLTVEGTGEFSGKTGARRAPWFGKHIKTAEINVTGMTDASYMFAGCGGLKEINLSGLDASSVTDMSGIFYECFYLNKIYTPCNLNIKFKLPTDSIPSTSVVPSVQPLYYIWKDSNRQEITELPVNRSDSILIMREERRSGSYGNIIWSIDDDEKLTVEGSGEFSGETGARRAPWSRFRSDIKTAEINVTGMTDASYMFAGCRGLTEINLSGLDASSVTNINGMFIDCYGLDKIYTPCNLNIKVKPPSHPWAWTWKDSNGQEITELPVNRSDSILIMREERRSGSYGNIIWSIDDDEKLTVEGSGEFSGETGAIRAPWSRFRSDIKTAEINVTGMTDASYMFAGCKSLEEINLSGLDTSSVTDMSGMFTGCKSLEEINLSGLDTSSVTDMSEMFSGCEGLTEINLSGLDTSSVTNMSGMFRNCDLTGVDLSGLNTSSVTDMSEMFSGCEGLTEINLSGLDTSSVTNMSGMFRDCDLTGADLSGLDTSSVINMSELFYKCSGTEIDLSGLDTRHTTNMSGMFKESVFISIDFSGFNAGNLTKNMSEMFYNCNNLQSVDFSNAKFSVGNMDDMFSGCNNLQSVNFSNAYFSVRYFNTEYQSGEMFSGCYNLRSVDFSNANFSSVKCMNYMFSSCYSLRSVDFSNANFSNVEYMETMFYKCGNLESVEFSNANFSSVKRFNEYQDQMMFEYCDSLKSVDFSNANFGSVKNMGGMFRGCYNLESVEISNANFSSVIDMSYLFSGCSSLTNIDLGSFVSDEEMNMEYMFSGCSSLTNIDLSNFIVDKVTSMEAMFSGCSNLKYIDLSGFNAGNATSVERMFHECDQLEKIYVPYALRISEPLTGSWYKSDGSEITELPRYQVNSIIIMKNQVPSVTGSSYIKACKKKTVYECGDILNTDDLTVKCYDADGTVKRVTDYTTNADQIDMSTSGIKTLVITYGGYTAEIPITLKGKETPVEISGITASDSVYTGTPFTYTGTATVMTSAGTDVTADISLTYIYTGTTADGKTYEASENAPVNAGNYKLTVAVPKEIDDYKGSAEYTFKITKAPIEVTALDVTFYTGKPLQMSYQYQTKGLLSGDTLTTEPSFTCNADMSKAGTYEIIPHDADAGMNYEIAYINGILTVKEGMPEKETVIISGIELSDSVYTKKPIAHKGNASVKLQDGTDITDSVTLTYSYSGTQADGSDYAASESTPVNAGEYLLTVSIPQDDEHYEGSVQYHFAITKAAVTVAAKDILFEIGKDTALATAYPYETTGLMEGDRLTKEPTFVYTDRNGTIIDKDKIDLKKAGSYNVIPEGADAGMNYTITYQQGIFTIKGTAGNLPGDDKEDEDNEDNEVLPDDIPPTDIPEKNTIWTSAVEDQPYTGTAVKPDIRVYFGKKLLTEKADYTLSYKNNKQLGTADIIITGRGNYKDKKTVHFNIIQKDISDRDVIIEDMAYADDGKQHKNAPNVIYNGKKLKQGKDFTVEYGSGDYTAAGEYYATIIGTGNFKGTYDKAKTVIIDKNMLLNRAKVAKIPNQEYNSGQEIILPDNAVEVNLNGTVLLKGTDYTVDYVNNQNVGKASVVIKGIGKYAGTKTVSFKIVRTPVNMAEADIVCDYDKEVAFCKGGAMPAAKVSYNGETLRNGTDYTVSYKNNKKCGTASLIIKGKGNFKGSKSFDYTVKQKELSVVAVRVADMVYVDKPNKYQSKPILTDADGNTLKAGTDYIVTGYEYDGNTLDRQDNPPENAEITVTVEGTGAYYGTCTASYQLRTGTNLNKAKITVADQSYTKFSVKPTETAITGASIKVNGIMQDLVYGRDYEIAAYGSNIKKGTGTVVLRGLGSYCGEKTVKFKIVGKSVE